jgi:hypothetical protein
LPGKWSEISGNVLLKYSRVADIFFPTITKRGENMTTQCAKPEVVKCLAETCSFNNGKVCRAVAINVGGPHQECDTFYVASQKGGNDEMNAGVGACKVESCVFNKSLLCDAKGVVVAWHGSHADCITFSEKH